MVDLSRRQFLIGAAAATAGLTIPAQAVAQPGKFRFAFLTDLHIQPELGAADGVAMAVKKLLSLNPRPEFVITGGDHVMDELNVTKGRTKLQFDLLAEALKPLEMPVHAAVGNHDVFGWHSKDKSLASDAAYGKEMFQECVARAWRRERLGAAAGDSFCWTASRAIRAKAGAERSETTRCSGSKMS